MVMMVMMVVMMMTCAGGVQMRLAGGVRGSGDRRAGDAKAQNEGGENSFHDRFSFTGAPQGAQNLDSVVL